MDTRINRRRVGDRWGGWVLKSDLTLRFQEGTQRHYEVDLEEISDARELLDWILQLISKEWMTPKDLGDFVYALNDCIRLRELLCQADNE